MTKIKICGLTRTQDVVWANELMPDYVGFVFAPSRRQLTGKQAAKIANAIDSRIIKVGVFVNPSMDALNKILDICPLDVVQLHGEESPEFCRLITDDVWKAFRIKDKKNFEMVKNYQPDAFLFDAFHPDAYGGTGETFDWSLMDGFKSEIPIVMAGGITIDNVSEVILRMHPMAIDVSSAVETDGIKDAQKIGALIRKVRQTDGEG